MIAQPSTLPWNGYCGEKWFRVSISKGSTPGGKAGDVHLTVDIICDAFGHPLKLFGTIQDITARKRIEEALQKNALRLSLLHDTTAQLLETDDPQKLVETLARRMMELLDCQAFFNFLLAPDAGRLYLNAYAGISPEEAAKIEWLELDVAICGCVAEQGYRLVAEDYSTYAGCAHGVSEELRHLRVCLPPVADDRRQNHWHAVLRHAHARSI